MLCRELAERFAQTLPGLEEKVEDMFSEVGKELKTLGHDDDAVDGEKSARALLINLVNSFTFLVLLFIFMNMTMI